MKPLKLDLTPEQVEQIGKKQIIIRVSGIGGPQTDQILSLARDWMTMYEALVALTAEKDDKGLRT